MFSISLLVHIRTDTLYLISISQHSEFYNGGSYPNDIALIKLDTPVSFSAAVQPIYIPNEGASFLASECWITGWGETKS
jgi:hypothetical protein